jgi:hypothetical protein
VQTLRGGAGRVPMLATRMAGRNGQVAPTRLAGIRRGSRSERVVEFASCLTTSSLLGCNEQTITQPAFLGKLSRVSQNRPFF